MENNSAKLREISSEGKSQGTDVAEEEPDGRNLLESYDGILFYTYFIMEMIKHITPLDVC